MITHVYMHFTTILDEAERWTTTDHSGNKFKVREVRGAGKHPSSVTLRGTGISRDGHLLSIDRTHAATFDSLPTAVQASIMRALPGMR